MGQFKTKKVAFSALAVTGTALLALTGCSGASAPVEPGGELTLRMGHVYEASHPMEACGVATLQEELEGSGINIESYPASQLGSEPELMEQLSTGSLDLALTGAFLETWHQPASVLNASYLFDDVDQFTAGVEGETIQNLFEDIADTAGMRVHSAWYYGTRQVTSQEEVNELGDLAGVKIRTVESPIFLKNIELMGGTATPMSLTEVYLGLQQGVIDAQENPIPTIASLKFNEIQNYVNLTNHLVNGVYMVSNETLLDTFSDEQKEAFAAALPIATAAANQCIIDAEQEILEGWKADGSIAVNDKVDTDSFAKAARDHWSKNEVFGDLYNQIRSEVG